ncbi:hypothetical protein, partial [Streptomyces sp. NPDC096068]|uniref:WXG100-like domain-containing protein n=1 Tax=Streptomyces sp. NPDC096068 TaxID=3155424 RepID=UPI00331BF87B
MSLMMPPGLNWIAQITVGEDFPQADEDRLREVARQLAQASARLERLSAQLGPVVSRVLESMSGSAVSEFTRFMRRLHTVVPGLADASGELGRSASETALQIEYAKLMIIMQMIITAIEVAHLLMLAPAAVPARVAATRLTVRQILRRLFLNILAGMAMELGLDAIAQTIQILRGDRTQWDTGLTTDALVGGAVGGAVEGLVAGAAGRFLPGLSRTTLGQAGIGGVSGLAETLVSNAVLGDDGELWMGAASGAFGRVISGPEVDTPDVKDLPDLGTLPLFKPETPDGIGETADGRVGTAPTDTATGPATTTTTLPVGVGVGVGAGSASASAVSRGGGS